MLFSEMMQKCLKLLLFISSIERSCPLFLYLFVSFFLLLLEKCCATNEAFLVLKKLPLAHVHLHCAAANANGSGVVGRQNTLVLVNLCLFVLLGLFLDIVPA